MTTFIIIFLIFCAFGDVIYRLIAKLLYRCGLKRIGYTMYALTLVPLEIALRPYKWLENHAPGKEKENEKETKKNS